MVFGEPHASRGGLSLRGKTLFSSIMWSRKSITVLSNLVRDPLNDEAYSLLNSQRSIEITDRGREISKPFEQFNMFRGR